MTYINTLIVFINRNQRITLFYRISQNKYQD